MLPFDTLAVDCRPYTYERLLDIFELFVPLGIKRFLFIYDVDMRTDNLLLRKESVHAFKDKLSSFRFRGVHSDIAYRLSLYDAVSSNPEIKKFFISKKSNSLLLALPLFCDTNDNTFAASLNTLLYRRDITPVFTSFESVWRSSSKEFCEKLLGVRSTAVCVDVNSLFALNNQILAEALIDKRAKILPCITHDISNYISTERLIEEFILNFGKDRYFSLTSQINRVSSVISG